MKSSTCEDSKILFYACPSLVVNFGPRIFVCSFFLTLLAILFFREIFILIYNNTHIHVRNMKMANDFANHDLFSCAHNYRALHCIQCRLAFILSRLYFKQHITILILYPTVALARMVISCFHTSNSFRGPLKSISFVGRHSLTEFFSTLSVTPKRSSTLLRVQYSQCCYALGIVRMARYILLYSTTRNDYEAGILLYKIISSTIEYLTD